MWPPPRSAMPSHMSRARMIGARRLTSSARSISSTAERLDAAAARDARVGDQDVDRTGLLDQPHQRLVGSVRSHAMARPPVSAASGSSTSVRLPVSTTLAPRRASARAIACPSPPLAPVNDAVRPPRFMREPSTTRAFRAEFGYANTATVAVKPCRNDSPPTGPISPAAKKPAAGAPASWSATVSASWSPCPNSPAAAAVAREQQRAGRRPPAERAHVHRQRLAQVAVGARRVARVQPHHLAGVHLGRHRHLAGVRIGAHQPAHEEVALHVVGLVDVDHDAHQQAALDEREVVRPGAPRSSRAASRAPACPPAPR